VGILTLKLQTSRALSSRAKSRDLSELRVPTRGSRTGTLCFIVSSQVRIGIARRTQTQLSVTASRTHPFAQNAKGWGTLRIGTLGRRGGPPAQLSVTAGVGHPPPFKSGIFERGRVNHAPAFSISLTFVPLAFEISKSVLQFLDLLVLVGND